MCESAFVCVDKCEYHHTSQSGLQWRMFSFLQFLFNNSNGFEMKVNGHIYYIHIQSASYVPIYWKNVEEENEKKIYEGIDDCGKSIMSNIRNVYQIYDCLINNHLFFFFFFFNKILP